MKKFVIMADNLPPDKRDAITIFIQKHNLSLWHWLATSWLLANVPDEWTPMLLQAMLDDEIKGNNSIIIMEVSDPIVYFGWGPPDSWAWMRQNWGRPG